MSAATDEFDIRDWRLSAGLSLDAAAAQAGVTSTTWRRAERGEPVRPLTAARIRKVVEASPIAEPAPTSEDVIDPPTYISPTDAAKYSRHHVKTILRALRAGELRGFQRTPGASWNILPEDLDAWIRGETNRGSKVDSEDTMSREGTGTERAFGRGLRREREDRGLSQAVTARELKQFGIKLDPSAITRIENNDRSVRLGEAIAITRFLRVSLGSLLNDPSIQVESAEPADGVDWRARALAAEAKLRRISDVLMGIGGDAS